MSKINPLNLTSGIGKGHTDYRYVVEAVSYGKYHNNEYQAFFDGRYIGSAKIYDDAVDMCLSYREDNNK